MLREGSPTSQYGPQSGVRRPAEPAVSRQGVECVRRPERLYEAELAQRHRVRRLWSRAGQRCIPSAVSLARRLRRLEQLVPHSAPLSAGDWITNAPVRTSQEKKGICTRNPTRSLGPPPSGTRPAGPVRRRTKSHTVQYFDFDVSTVDEGAHARKQTSGEHPSSAHCVSPSNCWHFAICHNCGLFAICNGSWQASPVPQLPRMRVWPAGPLSSMNTGCFRGMLCLQSSHGCRPPSIMD